MSAKEEKMRRAPEAAVVVGGQQPCERVVKLSPNGRGYFVCAESKVLVKFSAGVEITCC